MFRAGTPEPVALGGTALHPLSRLIGNVFASPPPETKAVGTAVATNGAGPQEVKSIRWTLPLVDFIPADANGNVFEVERYDWYAKHWLAYACMRIRALKFSEAPLYVWEEREGERAPLEGDHPIYPLLEEPNPDQDLTQLLYETSVLLDSTGAVLWVKNQDRSDRPGSVYAFGRDQFQVESDGTRLYARFRVNVHGGRQETYTADQVVYLREHDEVAPLHAAAARLGIDVELVRSMSAALRNAVTPGASLEFPDDFQPTIEQRQEVTAYLRAEYEGARNAGKLFSTGGGARLVKHQLGFAGIEGGELTKEIEAAVCGAFQCPPSIIGAYVGLQNSSDRANMETAERYLYDLAILPRWRRMESALTRQLLRDFDEDTYRTLRFDESKVAALQDDLAEQAKISKETADILTVNERRAILRYPPLDGPDGDRINAPAPPGVRGPLPLIEAAREDDEKAAVPPETKQLWMDRGHIAWQLFHSTAEAQEYGWALAVGGQLARDRAAVLALLEGRKAAPEPETKELTPRAMRALIREIDAALEEHAKAWREAMQPLAQRTSRVAVQRTASQLGISFDLLQPGATAYAQREAAWLVKQVTDTTKQAIRDHLATALIEGEGIPEIAQRIADAGAFAPSRAELIARTETTRITNGAGVESLRQYRDEHGGTFRKQWLTARDDRVRDEHAAMDGESVGLDDAFSNGLHTPGEPNCRCTTLLIMEG
jgi:HK97 family phage portal protein